MKNTTCSQCAYWERHGSFPSGECRRNAPRVFDQCPVVWPCTNEKNWCGDGTPANEKTTKPFSTYPEDHNTLINLAKCCEDSDDDNVSKLCDLVLAILEDERVALLEVQP